MSLRNTDFAPLAGPYYSASRWDRIKGAAIAVVLWLLGPKP